MCTCSYYVIIIEYFYLTFFQSVLKNYCYHFLCSQRTVPESEISSENYIMTWKDEVCKLKITGS